MENTTNINPIPYLTWSWLKINSDVASYDFTLKENSGKEINLTPNILITEGKSVKTDLPEPLFATGDAAAKLISDAAPKGKIYTFEKSNEEKPLIIRIKSEDNSATLQILHIKKGVSAKVIIVYEPSTALADSTTKESTEVPVLSGVITKVYAEDDSKLHLSKVQLCDKNVNQIDDTAIVCGERAKVDFTQIELGGSHVDAGFNATLYGYQSEFNSDTAYILTGNQYLDMNQVAVHKGKKTACDMKTHGTVKDESTKTYRGTIDLVKGCSGSNGNEIETTLLLSPKAVVKAAPIILCGEDDISAEHGSTIGKLSDDMLFYMNSRGIDEKTAEDLLSKAKITSAASSIEDESVTEEINSWIKNNL
jgi:Fe-S cluster assembly scaffold protein SufB